MRTPFSAHWQTLRRQHALALVIVGLALELPVRWVVRPDIPYMVRGNPWFNLPLRVSVELAFVLAVVAAAWVMKIQLPQIGIPFRRWTRWEWVAFAVVAAIELVVVITVAGQRWPRLFAAGVIGRALLWAIAEFLFGFNQEFVFRGALMTGLLRLGGYWWALVLNTLVFLIGPLHGPGLWHMAPTSPGAALGMLAGIVATGLFFSWLRYRSDNVILCGVLHGIVNGFLNGAAFARRAYL